MLLGSNFRGFGCPVGSKTDSWDVFMSISFPFLSDCTMKRIQWSVSCVVPAVIGQVSWIRHLCGWRRRATAPLKLDPQRGDFALRSGWRHTLSETSYQNIDFFPKETAVFRQLKIFSCRIPGLGGWVWISLTWFLLVRLWGRPKKPKKPKLPTTTRKNRRTKSCFVRSSETRSVTRSWKLWRSGYQHRIISFLFDFFMFYVLHFFRWILIPKSRNDTIELCHMAFYDVPRPSCAWNAASVGWKMLRDAL